MQTQMQLKPHNIFLRWSVQFMGLIFVYVLLGHFSRFLSIPPGYTIILFPPAGLALGAVLVGGYRLLPGVAIGAFSVSLIGAIVNVGKIESTERAGNLECRSGWRFSG